MPIAHLNNIDVYYQDSGQGDPVLFLHGLGGSADDWELQDFPGYRKIAMDVRGHGRSSKPDGPYTVAQFASDAAALLRFLNAAPAHIVGLSMGGMIAFQLAVDSPEIVRSLTIVNSGPEMILRTPLEQQAIQSRYAIVREQGMATLAKMITAPLFPKDEQAAMRERFERAIASNDPRAYLDSLNAIVGWTVMDRIGAIRCPALIVSSDQDYTPVDWKRAYAERLANARVAVLADSRHAAPLDQAANFNALVLKFLGELRRP